MKVFVFSTHNLWPSHAETELEIIQQHLDKGDTVYKFICRGELPVCDANLEHELTTCLRCSDINTCGKNLLEGQITELPILNISATVTQKLANLSFQYSNIEELKNISFENFDLGYAVASSLTSMLRDPFPDMEKNKEMIGSYLRSSLHVFYSCLEYIKTLQPDQIYVFNGRFAHVKPVLRASQLCKVDCYIHERGYDKFHYELFKNTTPHDRKYILDKMYALWEEGDKDTKVGTAESFYNERVEGKEQSWFSFTKDQNRGMLPENWDASKRNIAIFNSSEDEFASIGPDWKNELYNTQTEGIKRIVTDCLQYKDTHFYLRIHPNLIAVKNADKDELENLNFPNLTIITADSKASSYDLLFNCEKVIAFGSSVGIEAVYWGKPSIQAGKSYYFDMDVTYKPANHEALVKLITEELTPKDKTGALIYGYYYKSFGRPFKIYKATELKKGEYKGVDITQCESKKTRFFNSLRSNRLLFRIPPRIEHNYKKYKKKLKDYFL